MINKDEDTEEVIDIEQEVDEPDLKDQNISIVRQSCGEKQKSRNTQYSKLRLRI